MISRIIDFSARNRLIVLTLVAVAAIYGWWSMQNVALDAIPDLSDTQVIVYSRWDRSPDIIEVIITVCLIVLLFLWHIPSALIPMITIPIAVLILFIPFRGMGVTANIMSLGGIAIAIGAMVDAAIVVVEQAHKKLEVWESSGRRDDYREVVIKGMRDMHSGATLLMTEEELAKTMNAFQTELRRRQAEAAKVAADKNKREGEAFLAENSKKEGVTVLPSGLQYKILKAGDGKIPTSEDSAECHYIGTFIDGKEFDNSYKMGKPVTFKVQGGVIPGWSEALKLMPVGSKWQVFLPSQLAYGERGAGSQIGPNTTLIFEIELLSIK